MLTPTAVPNRDAKMYWLVFLAVMSVSKSKETRTQLEKHASGDQC